MFCGIFVTCCAVAAYSQSGAEQLLNERMRTPLLRVEGTLTGESLCWHAAYNMHKFMAGYRESRDTAYLSAGVKYYDALIATMHTSLDGYKGWVGPFIYDEKYICDVHIGDAILINPMLDFAEIVLTHEDAAILEEYAQKAQDYLELAKNTSSKNGTPETRGARAGTTVGTFRGIDIHDLRQSASMASITGREVQPEFAV